MPYPPFPLGVCRVFPSGTPSSAAKIYGTTTGTVTIGDGPVNIGKAGSATTVDGTLNVDQAVSFDTTLAVTGVVTLTEDLIVNGGDITHGKQCKETPNRTKRM